MSNLRWWVSVLGMKRSHDQDAQDADRQVDQEHPAPVVIVGQPAAEHRPEDRPDHHAAAEQRHRLAVLFARVDVEQGRLGERHDERAADALERAEQHHLAKRRRRRAQHRGDGEQHDRNQQQPLAPDLVGQPAADRQRDRRGDDIARQHPVDRVLRRAEARLHVRQGDVGDGRVEHLQQHRHHHPDGDDQPLAGRQRMSCDMAGVVGHRSALTCLSKIDGGVDRQAGDHRLRGRAVERDPHRHALGHLDPVAVGVLRRKQREFAAGAGADALDVGGELLPGIGIDLDFGALARHHPADVLLLEVRLDPGGLAVDQAQHADAGDGHLPDLQVVGILDHAVHRRADRRSATGRAWPCRPRPGPARSPAARQERWPHGHWRRALGRRPGPARRFALR